MMTNMIFDFEQAWGPLKKMMLYFIISLSQT